MTLLEKVAEILNSGDAEVRTWFLVRNNYLPFILCFSYVLMTRIGMHLMKNREPFRIRKFMIAFNFSIVIIYIISLLLAAHYFPQLSWETFCYEGKVKKGEPTYPLATVGWVVYLSKYAEFLDTFFFILRKKNNLVTFLHVFHHFSVPILGWVIFRTERSALQSIPALLNTFVHVVMYTYYGLAAMGPKMRKYLWWKKYLTQFQIVQFMLIIFFVAVIVPMSGCYMVASSYLMNYIFAPLFLILFYNFYIHSFTPTPKKVE